MQLSDLRYKHPFRSYQQRILDNFSLYQEDKIINIVAAPGSGKTILGLEMIRRLGAPALVLSPSITIRQQWGERFADGFLPEETDEHNFISYSLLNPKTITSITYQALHAAWAQTKSSHTCEQEDIEQAEQEELEEDFTDFDILSAVTNAGITTICLDEAHHLRAEWHRALEAFIKALKGKVFIISLTATPPYDSTPSQWKRYTDLCGEIDEEIFVPELVAEKTLCPHQDYIYFSYPITSEKILTRRYREQANQALKDLRDMQLIEAAIDKLDHNTNTTVINDQNYLFALDYEAEFQSLFRFAHHLKISVSPWWIQAVFPHKRLGKYRPLDAEIALQFMLDKPEFFGKDVVDAIQHCLAQHGLISRKRVGLLTNQKLNRALAGSIGKIQSIQHIATLESSRLKDALRMVILTDYIRADTTNLIGRDAGFTQIGAVPIFEAIRHSVGDAQKIALITGSLVIVPQAIQTQLTTIAEQYNGTVHFGPIEEAAPVPYSIAYFSSGNQLRVRILTEALENGLIQILVGTTALLGEGWDSPCINTLVLASFVGSFMLSNQMRGRAIRSYIHQPDKCANIWHLVTVEPPFTQDQRVLNLLYGTELSQDESVLGQDWNTLTRRFDCFIAPAYETPSIKSGIDRISIVTPPFTESHIEQINHQMEQRAQNRQGVAKAWQDIVDGSMKPIIGEMCETTTVPASLGLNNFTLVNGISLLAIMLIDWISGVLFLGNLRSDLLTTLFDGNLLSFGIFVLLQLIGLILLTKLGLYLLLRFSPKRRLQRMGSALHAALIQAGALANNDGRIQIDSDPTQSHFTISLKGTSLHDQHVFAEACKEMLSPIDNPRYILIKQVNLSGLGLRQYRHSFACPNILSKKKEDVEILVKEFKMLGAYQAVYTKTPEGRLKLWRCRERSLVNINSQYVKNYLGL
ncbi:DEAD/DEAH box helicase family protein [Atopobium fossor]|uniref:DEAD/DEAH box helicase family protein n=1 Tax=Atopobium fossor TaxID=39487 RepID=UPI0004034DC1|nr:DEAD/DEAH box helicase family protein [Atopobium fossor]